MARKTAATAGEAKVSADRAGRLYKLLKQVANYPVSRAQIAKKLKIGLRTFYRDVDLLRECGVDIVTRDGGYELQGKLEDALGKVPFPNPELTFGDVLLLMKGRTASHQRLKRFFRELTG